MIRFTIYDYLVTTNRETGGINYKRAKQSLERLKGTSITIETGSVAERNRRAVGFGPIGFGFEVLEEKEGKMIRVEVEPLSWLYNSITSKHVLKNQ